MTRQPRRTNPPQPTSQRPIGERWLGITNLVVTIIVGVIVAIYLHERQEQAEIRLLERNQVFQESITKRNEEFQKQIIQIQEEIQRQSNQALIEVNKVCYGPAFCDGTIEIKNNSFTPARNVRTVIYVSSINKEWADLITDTKKLNFEISDPSKEVNVNYEEVNAFFSIKMEGSNAIITTIDTLPAYSSIMFSLHLDNSIQAKLVDYYGDIIIRVDENDYEFYKKSEIISSQIEQAVKSGTSIVSLNTTTTCSNCSGNLREVRFDVPLFYSLYFLDNDKVETKQDDVIEIRAKTKGLLYEIPGRKSTISSTLELNAYILQDISSTGIDLGRRIDFNVTNEPERVRIYD